MQRVVTQNLCAPHAATVTTMTAPRYWPLTADRVVTSPFGPRWGSFQVPPAEEQWRGVSGFENHYEVSDHGRVRSLDRVIPGKDGRTTKFHGRVLSPERQKSGHLSVRLGNRKKYVHRLVLDAFVGPCPAGMEACHADDIPANNHLDNLRWASRSDNILGRRKNGIDPRVNRTHCKYGHIFSEENTHQRSGGGHRICKTCRLRRKREQNAKRKREREAVKAVAAETAEG